MPDLIKVVIESGSLWPSVPAWFMRLTETLVSFLGLPEGWDTYGAQPIRVESVQHAVELMVSTTTTETPEPAAVPTSSGGVQLEWHREGADLEIEIGREGDLHVCFCRGETFTDWDGHVSNVAEVAAFIAQLAVPRR